MTLEMLGAPKLRVARHPTTLRRLCASIATVGLQELYRFQDHAGFDGVMLGRPGAPYHFEFTHAQGHTAGRAPTAENLLVFYLPGEREWNEAVARLKGFGHEPVASVNPYWDQHGFTFEDPDGYRVVLQNAAWDV